MNAQETTILDKHMKGITARILWGLVVAVAIGVGLYKDIKTDIAVIKVNQDNYKETQNKVEAAISQLQQQQYRGGTISPGNNTFTNN